MSSCFKSLLLEHNRFTLKVIQRFHAFNLLEEIDVGNDRKFRGKPNEEYGQKVLKFHGEVASVEI